ncbi:hypothetical protein OKA05_23905 [Luteolibacter arcticus]|uniref:Type II secretory pathway, pseudopilin PulG n=1 Tax=Luteolibacter arcticus TaxID=1581411 RepID=A0ABT3GQ31_9BACT|nr:hypothetical protein [Luteolibacter arcticus]MCW1925624.1 hypothetical protein [Luteolibacter arcticus]
MSAILWVGSVCMVIALLVLVAWPVILTQRTAADRTQALGNLKSLYFALLDFDNDYGRFPDDSTIAEVKSATSTTIPLGTTSSNDYFRQLIAAGNRSERIFFAKTAATPHKPDDNISGARALEKGECSYAYVAGLSTNAPSGAPVMMAPMISGTWSFDPKPYGKKAVTGRIDGSFRAETLRPTGEIIIRGMNLFDPRQPIWSGKPNLKWPE